MVLTEYLPNYLTVKAIHPKTPIKFESKTNPKNGITIPQLIDKFVPEFQNGASNLLSPFLVNGHLQTAYASVRSFKGIDQVTYKRLVLNYKCGGEGTVDFAVKDILPDELPHQPQFQKNLPSDTHYTFFPPDDARLTSDDSKPMLIVLHGLAGGSSESYVRSLVHCITHVYNFEACVLNARGCCQSSITTPQLYNGGWTNDIRYFIKQLREMYPNRKFYMVGYSLGASVLTNYLGEEGDKSDISCSITVSVPWDLERSAYFINGTKMGQIFYSPALCKSLMNLTNSHLDELHNDERFQTIYTANVNRIKTLQQFDDCFTGPLFNYKDGMSYYKDASSYQRLPLIRTPLLALNALDDPITGADSLPEKQIEENPYTMMIETDIGGHVAWFENSSGKRWYTEPICKFLSSFHDEIASKDLKLVVDKDKLPTSDRPYVMTTYRDE